VISKGSEAVEKISAVAGNEVGGVTMVSITWMTPPAKGMSASLTVDRVLSPDVQIISVPPCITPPTRCPCVTLLKVALFSQVGKNWNCVMRSLDV